MKKLYFLNFLASCLLLSGSILAQNISFDLYNPEQVPNVRNVAGVDHGDFAFADVDNDGDPDLMVTGNEHYYVSKVYINDGGGSYTPNSSAFSGVAYGSIAFADVDNDSDLDLLISGENNSYEYITELYINDGNGDFQQMDQTPFIGVAYSSVAFADVDNDGDQDLMITGNTENDGRISKLYTNDGRGGFVLYDETSFLGVYKSSIAFADIDGDGDQDLAISGSRGYPYSADITNLYANDGTGNFSLVDESTFTPLHDGAIAFADIDGDSDMDFIINGLSKQLNKEYTKLYSNDGQGNFTINSNTSFSAMYGGDLVVADVNNDGYPDILQNGYSDGNYFTELYLNEQNGIFSLVNDIALEGVNYGALAFADVDSDGDLDILNGGENENASRIIELGVNDGLGNFVFLQSFITDVMNGDVAFADIDGDFDQDLMVTGKSCLNPPKVVSELYRNDGQGNYTMVDDTSFTPVINAALSFADFDDDGDQDLIIAGISKANVRTTKIYKNDGTGQYSPDETNSFVNVDFASISCADVDGDDDIDILIAGSSASEPSVCKLYLNDNSGGFSLSSSSFKGVAYGTTAFADVDGDGDQDLMTIGSEDGTRDGVSNLYFNDGDGNFIPDVKNSFVNVWNSATAFADIDNDSDLDLVITGTDDDLNDVSKIYVNDGKGDFTPKDESGLRQVTEGTLNFADFNLDGYQDLMLTGWCYELYRYVSILYINDGAGNFIENSFFFGLGYNSVAVVDVNNDFLTDILITGSSGGTIRSLLYLNKSSIYLPEVTSECIVYSPIYPTLVTAWDDTIKATTDTRFPIFRSERTNVNWTFFDPKSNAELDVTQYYNIIDTTPPVANCRNRSLILPDNGTVRLLPYAIDDDSYDNCGGIDFSVDKNLFDCSSIGTNDLVLTVSDRGGNTATCVSKVTIRDKTPPEITSNNITVFLDENGSYSLNDVDIAAITYGTYDYCSDYNELKFSFDKQTFDCSDLESLNNVKLTATDKFGNQSESNFDVEVLDISDPEITCNPMSFYLNDKGEYKLTKDDLLALTSGTTDNCTSPGELNYFAIPNTFSRIDTGENISVSVFVIDLSGNIGLAETTVTVADTNSFKLDCKDIEVNMDDTGLYALTDEDLNNILDDVNVENLSLSISQIDFSCDNTQSPQLVEISAITPEGETATCSFYVTVKDVSLPVVACSTIDIFLDENGEYTLTENDISSLVAEAHDNCTQEEELSMYVSPDYFNGLNIDEATFVELFVTDANGNTASCETEITLKDTFPPVLVNPLEDYTVYASYTLEIPFYNDSLPIFVDAADSNKLTYSVWGDGQWPEWVTFNSSMLTCSPALSDTGCVNLIIEATDFSGNSASDTFVVCATGYPTAINDVPGNDFGVDVYPNPTKGIVVLQLKSIEESFKLVVTDITGKQIMQDEYEPIDRLPIDLSNEVAGTYIIVVEFQHKLWSGKIIKE
ncbi:FG-GAP-like repeat-containing protein [uncultured Draconibacterium sp.]|uniref:FG-GAP-like repeat-containing protein n=1 Tax=uncultured Draconibacterium sp. TaxID=1573823 RepID=UPI002AA78E02|nr:FG-GAP-like repeat-containing protein [uncultured Draconibacterium sp.]